MDRQIYRCTWEKADKSYKCYIKEKPEIFGEGPTLKAADAALLDNIIASFADFQPFIEYLPPFPPSSFDIMFRGRELAVIRAPNELVGSITPAQEIFSRGVCPLCGKGQGVRTSVALTVREFPKIANGMQATVKPGGHGFPIFSEEFLGYLDASELASVELRPVASVVRSKRKFYEIICNRSAPAVFVKGVAQSGWECDECKRLQPRPLQKFSETEINYFVSDGLIPEDLPSCIAVFTLDKYFFCMPRVRWEAIVAAQGGKGLAPFAIGIAPKHLIDSNPKVERVSEIIKKYGRF